MIFQVVVLKVHPICNNENVSSVAKYVIQLEITLINLFAGLGNKTHLSNYSVRLGPECQYI